MRGMSQHLTGCSCQHDPVATINCMQATANNHLARPGQDASCLLWAAPAICRMPAGILHPHLRMHSHTASSLTLVSVVRLLHSAICSELAQDKS